MRREFTAGLAARTVSAGSEGGWGVRLDRRPPACGFLGPLADRPAYVVSRLGAWLGGAGSGSREAFGALAGTTR